jgi:hypothetical protein
MGTFRIRTRTKRKIKKALKKYGPAVGLLIFTIALLFRACKIETPYSLLGEAVPKTLSLDAFAIENQITVVSQEQGISKTRNFTKRLQISGYQTDRMISSANTDNIAFYNESLYSYAVIDGDSMKFKKENIPVEYLEFVDVTNELEHMLIALPESLLDGVKIQKENDLKIISVSLTVNAFATYYGQYVNENRASLIRGYRLDDFALSDIVSITVAIDKKGYLDSYSILYKGKGIKTDDGIQEEIWISVEDRMIFMDSDESISVKPMIGYLNFPENVSAPYHLLESAMTKTKALDAIQASYALNMNVDMSLLEKPTDIPIYAVIQATNLQSGKPMLYSKRNIFMLNVSKETEVYREGSYYYIYIAGQGIKIKSGIYTHNYDVLSDLQELTQMLPERILMNGNITEQANGTKIVEITVPKADVTEIFDFHVDEAVMAIASDAKIQSVSPTDARVLITVSEDGYLLSYSTQFDMNLFLDVKKETSAQGMDTLEVKVVMDSIVNYTHPSVPVTVTPMEGYEDFPYIEY